MAAAAFFDRRLSPCSIHSSAWVSKSHPGHGGTGHGVSKLAKMAIWMLRASSPLPLVKQGAEAAYADTDPLRFRKMNISGIDSGPCPIAASRP
jgi:hypothetical protein